MFAQLGDHIFQGLKTPTSASESDAVKYGQIPRVNDSPAIQPTGRELKEINLTIQFSVDFCEPTSEIEALKKSMHNFEVLPYITGDGRIIGKYVITIVEVVNQLCGADGRVEMATVTVNLLESPGGPDPEPVGQALASQKPVTTTPVAPVPSPAVEITNDLDNAKSNVSGIKQTLGNIKNQTTTFKRGVREVRQAATDAQTLYAAAKTKVEATQKIVKRASELPASLNDAIKYAENLANLDDTVNISVLEKGIDQLSQSAEKVATRATPVVAFVGTKEGDQ